jgi:hypothetical protein
MFRTLIFFVLCINVCFAQFKIENQNLFNKNLIVNGDAELGSLNRKIHGWETIPPRASTDFLLDSYGMVEGEWKGNCDQKCGLPPDAGENYFRFPLEESYRTYHLVQRLDINEIKDELEGKNIYFLLNAYVAGFECPEFDCAKATLSIAFKDQEGKVLKNFMIEKDHSELKGVGEDQRLRKFELIFVNDTLPENTVSAEIMIKGDALCCERPFTFYDNISLILSEGDKRKKE